LKKHEFSIYNLYCYGETYLQVDELSGYLGKFDINIPDIFTATIIIEHSCLKFPQNGQPGTTKTGSMTIEVAECCNMDAIQISEDVCSLISLAVNGLVFCNRKEEGLYSTPNSTSKGGWRQIVINKNGAEIRRFVEACWPNYDKFREPRKLFAVIRMLVKINEMRPHIYIDQRLILTAVLLENLKYTFADSKDYPRIGEDRFGYITKPNNPVSFKNLIRHMVEAVNMPNDFDYCIDLLTKDRNQIIHEGIFNCPPEDMTVKAENMFSFIQVYLLALLDFSGHYYVYNEDNVIKSFLID